MLVVLTTAEPERGLSTEVYTRNGKQVVPFCGYMENVLPSSPLACLSLLMAPNFAAGSGKSILA